MSFWFPFAMIDSACVLFLVHVDGPDCLIIRYFIEVVYAVMADWRTVICLVTQTIDSPIIVISAYRCAIQGSLSTSEIEARRNIRDLPGQDCVR